jgi:hypothetical protein
LLHCGAGKDQDHFPHPRRCEISRSVSRGYGLPRMRKKVLIPTRDGFDPALDFLLSSRALTSNELTLCRVLDHITRLTFAWDDQQVRFVHVRTWACTELLCSSIHVQGHSHIGPIAPSNRAIQPVCLFMELLPIASIVHSGDNGWRACSRQTG